MFFWGNPKRQTNRKIRTQSHRPNPANAGMVAGLPKCKAYLFFRGVFIYQKDGKKKGCALMLGKSNRFKTLLISFLLIASITSYFIDDAWSDSVSIKGSMKIQRMGGYVILINYETRDKWTDSILFKVYCKFSDGEFTFASSSLNNLERGWHKTEIAIGDVIKKRYGSLREYRIDLYKNGILTDTRTAY